LELDNLLSWDLGMNFQCLNWKKKKLLEKLKISGSLVGVKNLSKKDWSLELESDVFMTDSPSLVPVIDFLMPFC